MKTHRSDLQRADKLLVNLGYASSRTFAQKLIESACVEVEESGIRRPVTKTSEKLRSDACFHVREHEDQKYASRAGLKLEGALDKCRISVEGLNALDIGQSTGGFSDCLLARGCKHVTGVDVGHNQLLDRLRNDPRIRCIEGLNARELSKDTVEPCFDIAVMDVSFISQTLILPNLPQLLRSGAMLVSLVKPQFEVGPDGIGKGGIVRNANLYRGVQQKLTTLLESLEFCIEHYFESPIKGGDGNIEFFLVARYQVSSR